MRSEKRSKFLYYVSISSKMIDRICTVLLIVCFIVMWPCFVFSASLPLRQADQTGKEPCQYQSLDVFFFFFFASRSSLLLASMGSSSFSSSEGPVCVQVVPKIQFGDIFHSFFFICPTGRDSDCGLNLDRKKKENKTE